MKPTLNAIDIATISLDQGGGVVRCSGAWVLSGIGKVEAELEKLGKPANNTLQFDVAAISAIDTAGAWLLQRTLSKYQRAGYAISMTGMTPELDALMKLNKSDDLPVVAKAKFTPASLLHQLGRVAWPHWQELIGMLAFVGEVTLVGMRMLRQPSRIRWKTILYNLQHTGFNSLPIVGLLAFLMGVVISFQGAGQLLRYGANIFIVDLVGLSMLRELAPLMTAIIVAGRSGSAFAAQIGTMKVTEEIDALRTIGISPMELLVLPKIVALAIALPLLSIYADLMGVLGGMVMAKSQLGVNYADFMDRFGVAVNLSALMVGLGKAPIFAVIIALVGCFQGLQVSNGSDSVGRQTTKSVVQAIFLIIVADALFSVAFSWLKI